MLARAFASSLENTFRLFYSLVCILLPLKAFSLLSLFPSQLSKTVADASFLKGIQRYLKFEKGASVKGEKAGMTPLEAERYKETLRLPLLRVVFEAIDKAKSGSVGCSELATFGQVRNAAGSCSVVEFQDLPLPSH